MCTVLADSNQGENKPTYLGMLYEEAPWGENVSMLTHSYPQTLMGKIKLAICIHHCDDPFYLWPDACSGMVICK